MNILFLILFVSKLWAQRCDHQIYCNGKILETIQNSGVLEDGKQFVDLKMKLPEKEIIKKFQSLIKKNPQPSKAALRIFLNENFDEGNELEWWSPTDFQENPPLLDRITNETYKNFSREIIGIWPQLSRKIKKQVVENSTQYSIIPVKNGFIVPSTQRFKEFYYWDSYWIQKGLFLSDMKDTVKGMLENFFSVIERYGFIPSGGRIYYIPRSHPPLLTVMVSGYVKETNNYTWLKKYIALLDTELKYWLKNKMVKFNVNGKNFSMAHYNVNVSQPRPEAYKEDFKTCGIDNECLMDLQSASETGWDFSSRWIFDNEGGFNGNLSNTKTRRIIPVDLNAILAQAFKILSNMYKKMENNEKSTTWLKRYIKLKSNIDEILYNKEDGIWYDFDVIFKKHRRAFYPSNFAPLWADLYDSNSSKPLGLRALNYLRKEKILDFPSGVPTSLFYSGQQWDLPNAWPILQSMVALALERSRCKEAQQVAKTLAKKWLDNNLLVFQEKGKMYDKYDVLVPGKVGGGGEYEAQSGFGWTNGVALELVDAFFSRGSKHIHVF